MEYALSKKNAEELSHLLTSIITGLSDEYSPGECVLALTVTLALIAASVKPDRLTPTEWYEAVEAVLRPTYDKAHEKLRRG
jgi:hypothetical protein